MGKALEAGKLYRAPSVVAIGWIPSLGLLRKMPSAFGRHRRWWGLKPLFLTGNPPPPASFSGEEDFQEFVRSKEYRAILGVTGVEVGFDGGRSSTNSPHGEITKGGYTPFGMTIGVGKTSVSLRHYSSGESKGASSIALGGDHAPIGKSLHFRIGKAGNLGSKVLIGHYAPHAWMSIGYDIFSDGRYEITFSGTFIPNQTYYVDWHPVHEYRMETISGEHLDDFLTSETRGGAPATAERYVHRGTL